MMIRQANLYLILLLLAELALRALINRPPEGPPALAQKALAGKAGIYCIRSLNLRSSGKCYVGSAVNLYERMCEPLWPNGSH
jgi:hypothetical protein